MDLLANLSLGFSIALSPYTLMLAIVGCFLGTIIGALPGLGPSNGVAILIPLTFTLGLDATSALVLMTSVYYGAMYGGAISSIMLGIPGASTAVEAPSGESVRHEVVEGHEAQLTKPTVLFDRTRLI